MHGQPFFTLCMTIFVEHLCQHVMTYACVLYMHKLRAYVYACGFCIFLNLELTAFLSSVLKLHPQLNLKENDALKEHRRMYIRVYTILKLVWLLTLIVTANT